MKALFLGDFGGRIAHLVLAKIAERLGTTMEFLLDEGAKVTKEDAADAQFYRQYRKMDSATKDKIRQMVKLWGDEG